MLCYAAGVSAEVHVVPSREGGHSLLTVLFTVFGGSLYMQSSGHADGQSYQNAASKVWLPASGHEAAYICVSNGIAAIA